MALDFETYWASVPVESADELAPTIKEIAKAAWTAAMLEQARETIANVRRLEARVDNAYYAYLRECREEAGVAWEIKVELGVFGYQELRAYQDAAEQLGKYRGLKEAATLFNE